MPVITQMQAERAELDAVLHSGIFHRAPNLHVFLRYVCERYFDGETDQLKEYNIAVEALGRSADFDQRKDSIVRVEALRLRKRLAEYYLNEGASHAVHICIPNGQYAPRFLMKEPAAVSPAEDRTVVALPLAPATAPDPPLVLELTPPPPPPRRFQVWALVGLACLVLGALAWWAVSRSGVADNTAEVWNGPMDSVAGEFRFLAGYSGIPFRDRQGRIWQTDRFYKGGRSRAIGSGRVIEGTPDPAFPRTYREGIFRYDIPVVEGTYELHLYFAETQFGDGNPAGGVVNSRLFRVSLNGHTVLNEFDVLSAAGAPNRLNSQVFADVTPGKDGKIHLLFEALAAQPILNALELLPSSPGRVRPVRIVAAKSSVVDTDGSVWLADQFAVGGTQSDRHSVFNGPLKMLFEGERYGNFSYHIPLPQGKYKLRLYFAETFFGSKLNWAGNALPGRRVFNVFANGVALLRNFDVFEEAGGNNRPLVKLFRNLEPNAQGKLLVEFVPVKNYAEVNAVEVMQEE